MTYIDNESKNVTVNYCGRHAQDRMIKNGWSIRLRENYSEYPQDLYDRLSVDYKQVKIYWDSTAIRGCHTYFAMVRN